MKKLLLIAIISCYTVIIGTAQNPSQVAQKQYESGDYLLAIQNYLKSKTGNSYSFDACIQIARCYDALGINKKAYKWYKKAKSVDDLNYQFDLEIGKSAMKEGLYSDAAKYFSNYSSIENEIASHFINMANNVPEISATSTETTNFKAFENNTLANEFAPIVYNDRLLLSLDVKNVDLDKQAAQLVENPGSSILCDETNNPFLSSLFIKSNISPIAISNSNHVAYSKYPSRCQAFKARRENSTLYTAVLANGQLVNIKPFPYNKIEYSITDPYLTEDGMTLYFSANIEGGYGGYDLYYSINQGGKWSKPINLGSEINTIGNEISPNLSEDNQLYFASDYHFGLGGYDIFQAQYLLGEWMNVKNLGNQINSSNDDYFPFISNNTLYFTSIRDGGKGGEDIYSVTLPQRDIVVNFDGSSPTLASNKSIVENHTIIQDDIEQDVPSAVYIGDYESRTISRPIAGLPVKSNEIIPVRWNVKMERAAVPKITQIPNADVATVEIPPAFKIPEIKTQTHYNNTVQLVNYEGAKLVSVGKVIDKPVTSVYFVQLAAFYSSGGNINVFESLSSFGNIYKVFAGTAVKVRLGYFNDHKNASEVLARVRSLGYKDAFLVNTDLNTANMELIYSNFDQNNVNTNTTVTTYSDNSKDNSAEESSNNFEYSKDLDRSSVQEYKVRLASYEDPIWFESSKIKDLGQLEQWSKGSWTIFILSGFTTYEEAEQARIKAVNRGYADAEVVIDNQGIIERLKKN